MTTDRSDVSAALLDVRKAFRLLWGYHRRVRDIVELCSKMYPDEPASKQRFSVSPLSGRGNPLSAWWTWDCTPTVDWTFLFVPAQEKAKGGPSHMMAINFVADTAFEDSDLTDPDPAKLGPVGDARSVVDLTLYQAGPRAVVDWPRIWDSHDLRETAKSADPLDGPDGESSQYFAYWQRYAMEDFEDEPTIRRIVSDFRSEAFAALKGRLSKAGYA